MDWLQELGSALVSIFIQPLVYWIFFLLLISSYFRIKSNRATLGVKIYPKFYEIFYTGSISVVAFLVLSLLSIGLGITFTYTFSLIIAFFTILFTFFGRFSLLSAAYTGSLTFLILFLLPYVELPFLSDAVIEGLLSINLAAVVGLIGLLLIVESIIMFRMREDETLPEQVKSSRGKWVGQHRLKKLAFIPFIGLIPTGNIEPFASWWPVIDIQGESFGLMVFPFIIGFEHLVKSQLPIIAAKILARRVLLLGLLTIVLGVVGYFLPIVTLIAIIIVILGREFTSIQFKMQDKVHKPIFQPDQSGVRVLAVLRNSAGRDLGIIPGEKIIKVNGLQIQSGEEFYYAVQQNGAYCKLEILDLNGEIRFAQRALYEGENYKLGILWR